MKDLENHCGIYIHIPFCRAKCPYCDFYSVVKTEYSDDFVSALGKEVECRSGFINCKTPLTIYLGGGSPSILDGQHLEKILNLL